MRKQEILYEKQITEIQNNHFDEVIKLKNRMQFAIKDTEERNKSQ